MPNAVILLNDAYSIRDNLPADLQYLVQDTRFEVSSRMTRCAGKAWNRQNLVQLSLAYFADQGNYETEFRNTVLHELAHLIANRRAGYRVGHGSEWKAIAVRIGARPERCHRMKLADGFNKRKQFPVPCGRCNQTIHLGQTQYKRHLQGYAGYRHNKCPLV